VQVKLHSFAMGLLTFNRKIKFKANNN